MKRIDRDALTRALAIARAESEQERERLDEMVRSRGWQEAAEFAAYCCQDRNLRLRPWEAPPCHSHDVMMPDDSYGNRPDELALRQRLRRAKLSIWEPDVLNALERAEQSRLQ
jgi:hypothetical protein